MENDPVKKILTNYDSSVHDDTMKQFRLLLANLKITDYSLLDVCMDGARFQLDEKPGWINSKETFEITRQYLTKNSSTTNNKTTKLTPNKTPTKATPSKFSDDFSARKNKGVVDASLGDSSKFYTRKLLSEVRVDEYQHNLQKITNFYCEPIKQRREALLKRVKFLADKYIEFFDEMRVENFNRFSNLSDRLSKDSTIFCIGRIVPGEGDVFGESNTRFEDFDESQNKSTICTLELKETKQMKCIDGQLVESEELFFFPSQIVVIEGNYDKESSTFICQRVYLDNFNDNALILKKNEDAYDDVRHYNIVSASGPFFFQDSLQLTLFDELMKRIKEEEPAVVILTGPFVDVRNEIVKSGDITFKFGEEEHSLDYEEFFDWLIQRIEAELKSLDKTKVYIIPSTLDAHHPYPIPQPPYQYSSKNKVVKMLSNPAQLIIKSDVRLSVVSGDFLIDMTKSSYSKIPQGGSKLGLPLKETLNQRLVYPVYPSSTMLDTTLYDKMTYDEIPNLVLYNSILGSTIKVAKDTIFVNHGSVFKQGSGGTYAKIIISTEQKKKMEERTCVEIKRI